jgi:hypothetical protein
MASALVGLFNDYCVGCRRVLVVLSVGLLPLVLTSTKGVAQDVHPDSIQTESAHLGPWPNGQLLLIVGFASYRSTLAGSTARIREFGMLYGYSIASCLYRLSPTTSVWAAGSHEVFFFNDVAYDSPFEGGTGVAMSFPFDVFLRYSSGINDPGSSFGFSIGIGPQLNLGFQLDIGNDDSSLLNSSTNTEFFLGHGAYGDVWYRYGIATISLRGRTLILPRSIDHWRNVTTSSYLSSLQMGLNLTFGPQN